MAAAGAVSRPSRAVTVVPSRWRRKAPPPRPLDCGSTRPRTICTAIAASTAEPPSRSICAPASAARGLAAATIQCAADQPGFSVQPVACSGVARVASGKVGAARAEGEGEAVVGAAPFVLARRPTTTPGERAQRDLTAVMQPPRPRPPRSPRRRFHSVDLRTRRCAVASGAVGWGGRTDSGARQKRRRRSVGRWSPRPRRRPRGGGRGSWIFPSRSWQHRLRRGGAGRDGEPNTSCGSIRA